MLLYVCTFKFNSVILVFLPSHSCLVDIHIDIAINNSLETNECEFMNRIALLCYFVSTSFYMPSVTPSNHNLID